MLCSLRNFTKLTWLVRFFMYFRCISVTCNRKRLNSFVFFLFFPFLVPLLSFILVYLFFFFSIWRTGIWEGPPLECTFSFSHRCYYFEISCFITSGWWWPSIWIYIWCINQQSTTAAKPGYSTGKEYGIWIDLNHVSIELWLSPKTFCLSLTGL